MGGSGLLGGGQDWQSWLLRYPFLPPKLWHMGLLGLVPVLDGVAIQLAQI